MLDKYCAAKDEPTTAEACCPVAKRVPQVTLINMRQKKKKTWNARYENRGAQVQSWPEKKRTKSEVSPVASAAIKKIAKCEKGEIQVEKMYTLHIFFLLVHIAMIFSQVFFYT